MGEKVQTRCVYAEEIGGKLVVVWTATLLWPFLLYDGRQTHCAIRMADLLQVGNALDQLVSDSMRSRNELWLRHPSFGTAKSSEIGCQLQISRPALPRACTE